MSTPPQPLATYRLQLTPIFTLHDAARLVPYLRDLGITHLYLSPIFEALAGSSHGYDITDPCAIRSELGGESGLDALIVATRTAGLGIIIDIVPNHMSASIENPWWRDLLEFGVDSPHTRVFDLSWRSDADQRRILLPVLGHDLAAVLERGEIGLDIDDGGFVLLYGRRAFPLTPSTYAIVLEALDLVNREPPDGFDAGPFRALDAPPLLDDASDSYRRERAAAARDAFLRQLSDAGAARPLTGRLTAWNERVATDRRAVLEEVLERQVYELAFWRRSMRESSYRRFFDIVDLVGIHVDDPVVLAATHRRILTLVAGNLANGIRVDHVDGLYDPLDYLNQLARAGGEAPPYLVVEKVLSRAEVLPEDWPAAGTTGYDFLTTLDGWFIDPEGWSRLRNVYVRVTGDTATFEATTYNCKREAIERLFVGELRSLLSDLAAIAATAAPAMVQDMARLSRALAETSACLDVYRTYIRCFEVDSADHEQIERAINRACERAPDLATDVLPWLRDVLLLDVREPLRLPALHFVMRWQQFTGPVMAKGYEDTALYRYNALTSANEVGGDPGVPAVSTDELHSFLEARARRAPLGLNASSTHDTKRGEDARARIAVLSEIPDEWARFLEEQATALSVADPATPSPADLVLLHQTLVATSWSGAVPDQHHIERIVAYMTKAGREAKVRTSWRDPDAAYESALADVVRTATRAAGPFHDGIKALTDRIALPGALGSLSRTLVKLTAPGVPDSYQGAELWHDALV
ncbi:MAG: malto-oligosyltrehalose synthase, partial [Longimicrobiales bacterium]